MKKTPSILAAALQLLTLAGLLPVASSAKVNTPDPADGTISERVARLRTVMIEQAKSTTDENGIQLTGWGNWGNGWRNFGNGGWGKIAPWGKGGWGNGGGWGKGAPWGKGGAWAKGGTWHKGGWKKWDKA
jgi:rSAM-associated Gly-rich repeat protein